MLVESIIKKTLDLKFYCVKKVSLEAGMLVVEIGARQRSKPVCSLCGRKVPGYDVLGQRSWYHVPCWGIPVRLLYRPRRGRCPECGIKVEAIPWSRGKSAVSVPLMVVVAVFARRLPWQDVGRLFGLHWNTVKAAVNHVVDYGLEHRELNRVIHIGIDELSRRRGFTYVTMIYDLVSGDLLWTGDGRGKETLEQFFAEWGQERTKAIQGICCDMWEPYIGVIREKAPHAVLVFDKFHVIQQLMKAVDEVRRQEAAEKGKEHKNLMKGTRYIWLKNPRNLTEKQRVRLSQLEKLNLKINRAYLLKEQFRQFWDLPSLKEARTFLQQWFWLATHSRLKPLRDFAWMLRRHETHILNYFRLNITAGRTEGMNRKAKIISQRCYGFRTFDTIRLAFYHCLGNLPMPTLTHKFV